MAEGLAEVCIGFSFFCGVLTGIGFAKQRFHEESAEAEKIIEIQAKALRLLTNQALKKDSNDK